MSEVAIVFFSFCNWSNMAGRGRSDTGMHITYNQFAVYRVHLRSCMSKVRTNLIVSPANANDS